MPPKMGSILNERICSYGSKFFLLRIDLYEEARQKMKMTELFPLKVCPFTLVDVGVTVWQNNYMENMVRSN